MGKITGFLEYDRQNDPAEQPLDRIEHWKEFHPRLSEADRRQQGARCMECGVPFCQSGATLGGMTSGCPLHNLVPEWNDLLYTGNLPQALERLLKTNNFPEFTGRVCPALCEAACTCGLHGDPVTVRENELGIIEAAFERGLLQPRPPRVRSGKRVAVVGSGPAGLAAAQCLADQGHAVTVYEASDRPGGLLEYGIPNMKLEKGVVARKVEAMQAQGVTFRTGVRVGAEVSAQELTTQYDAVVLCVGTGKARTLSLEGAEGVQGIHGAVEFLTSNTKSLLDSGLSDGRNISAQGKHVVIVGGGDTGNDCVGTSLRTGCASVTQIEMLPAKYGRQILHEPHPPRAPEVKTDSSQEEYRTKFGVDPHVYQTTVKAVQADEAGNLCAVTLVELEPVYDAQFRLTMRERPGTERTIPCQMLIVAAGFLGPCPDVAEAFGVTTDARSNLAAQGYATNVAKVFACGDCRTGQSLVVKAMADGRDCAKAVGEFLK